MVCQLQPIQAGIRTERPRLETRNSSVTPRTTAMMNACRYNTADTFKARASCVRPVYAKADPGSSTPAAVAAELLLDL